MIQFAFEMDLSKIDEQLARMLEGLGPLEMDRFLTQVGNSVRSSVKKHFRKAGAEEPWAPLALSTLRRRRYPTRRVGGVSKKWAGHLKRHGMTPGRKTRAVTTTPLGGAGGTLGKAVSVHLHEDGQDSITVRPAGPRGYGSGSKRTLGQIVAYHHRGGARLPRRQAYVLTDKEAVAIVRLLERFIDKVLGIYKGRARRFQSLPFRTGRSLMRRIA